MAKGQAITYEQFLAIEKALNEGMKGTDIAQLTGLSENLISQIKTGEHHFCKQKEEQPKEPSASPIPLLKEIALSQFQSVENTKAILEQLQTLNDTLTKVHTALCRLKIDSEKIAGDTATLAKELKG